MNFEQAKEKLHKAGQEHVLAYYEELTKEHGKASDCVECGQCEGACPQHLPAITWLKKVVEVVGNQ